MNARCTSLRPPRMSLLLVVAPLLCGCATMIHGTRQDIRVETDPPGAIASVGDQKVATPGVLRLKRKEKALEIVVEMEGYVTKRVALTRKDSGWQWLNMIGIPVGIGVGAVQGANHTGDSADLSTGITNTATGAVIGGVVLSGAGFLIDHGDGAAYKLDPPLVVLRLEPVPTATSSPSTEGTTQ